MSATDFYGSQPFNNVAWGHKTYDEFMEQFFNPAIKHIVEDVELPSLGEGEEIAMAAMFTNKDN